MCGSSFDCPRKGSLLLNTSKYLAGGTGINRKRVPWPWQLIQNMKNLKPNPLPNGSGIAQVRIA